MQTFLPYPSFLESAKVLDKKRCWKQVVEAKQILSVLKGETKAWANHPAVKMWIGYDFLLTMYYDMFLQVCIEKHGINTKLTYLGDYNEENTKNVPRPFWLGDEDFHRSHRARLIEKDRNFYLPLFPKDEGFNNGKYFWPDNETKTFKII